MPHIGPVLKFSQFKKQRSPHRFAFLAGENRFMIDCTVGLEMIEERARVVIRMSSIRRSRLGLLVAAASTFDIVFFSLLVEPIKDHFGIGLSFAHKFKFEFVMKCHKHNRIHLTISIFESIPRTIISRSRLDKIQRNPYCILFPC
jgi:hypothetical protein